MGYDRNDRGGYRGSNWNRDRGQDRDYGRQPHSHDADDRGFLDRAGDEVRSWFGDEDAERRRRMDEQHEDRYRGGERSFGGGQPGRGDYQRGGYGRDDGERGNFGSTRGG